MAKLLYTTQNLVDEVRSQLDEENQDSIDTSRDILPALNRANDYAFDIYSHRYPEPILQHTVLELNGTDQEYDIPENIFEDRLLKVEIQMPTTDGFRATYREVQRISYSDLALYESSSQTNIPYYYAVVGRKLRFVPAPSGTFDARIWSLKQIEKLVLPQGRITVVNSVSNYIIVDSAGSSLTTEADQLGSYVNLVDGQTGEIKGSMQIQILADNKITFRTTPTRSAVLNREIQGDLSDIEVSLDDYICAIDGSCISYFGTPTNNFLIQYAVAELTRKLGGSADMEEKVLEKFEKQVERNWVGRETTRRVKKRSQSWGVPVRRWEFE